MRVTVLSHNLSSNAAMRAHRLAIAARSFADVTMIGPVRRAGPWPALSDADWIRSVRKRRFPEFAAGLLELTAMADGDVLLAVKPHLASFGVALAAGAQRDVPVVLDVDDLDEALAPRSEWTTHPEMTDLSRPGSAVYVALLSRAAGAAAAVTAASTTLAARYGGTVVPHGADTTVFDPAHVDRQAARARLGFSRPTVLFPGTPRGHKGVEELARAVQLVADAVLAVTCRPEDMAGPEWADLGVQRVPMVPHAEMPALLAAADVIAVPQRDTEVARHQMPMKVYDAMAMARPVVATAVSDLPGLLDGCGVVIPPGDVDALAAAIGELLADRPRAAALGGAARARIQDGYTLRHVATRLEQVCRQVLGSGPPGPGGA